MHPALKLIGLAVAPLVLSLPIAVLMEGGRAGATPAASPKQHAQESISEKKAEGDRLLQQGIQQAQSDQAKLALQSWQQALQIYRAIKDREGEGAAIGNLGIAYTSLGDYAKAIEYIEQGLAIHIERKNRIGEGIAFNALGIIYHLIGNYRRAIECHKKGVLIAQETGDIAEGGARLGNLGIVYQSLEDYTTSIKFLDASLTIAQRMKNRRNEGSALGNLGRAYEAIGNWEKAILYQEKSLAIARELGNKRGEHASLSGLGVAHYSVRNYSKAISYLNQSLVIARTIQDKGAEALYLNNLGMALLSNKNPQKAEGQLLQSAQISESMRLDLTDDQRRSLFETQSQTYRLLQQAQVALKKQESAIKTSDRGRARAFVELLAARFAGETLENAVAQQKVERLSIAQIQQVAKTQAATLVQYSIVSEKDLYIYIVQPNGSIQFRQANLTTLGKSLNDFVNASRDGLGVRGRSDEAQILTALSPQKQRELQEQRDRSLRQLHQLLIEPIADLLPKNETDRVIFMPQGELFLVPFPALLNAQNQPLITQHTILTAPSIQTLDLTHKTALSHPKGNRPALVVGNPTMPAVSTVIGDPPKTLSPLPGSETEAIAIAQQLNTQAITGTNARKDVVMQKMQNAGIIHLATHGLLDSFKGDTPGAIALAPNGNRDRNDGLLTSGEIFDLKLNADLVVLSACDTGRGDITGDGVIGLSRSLFVAGVPSVIVSLWKVPDEPTALLMAEFYKNWKDRKLDKAQALRQAMLTTRKKNPNPRDWAAFTLIGEAE
jgi:CHAT domain-containing protein